MRLHRNMNTIDLKTFSHNFFYPKNLLVLTWELQIFLKKREHQKKDALKQKIEASWYALYWDFKKIPFTLWTYVLAKILQNNAKSMQNLAPKCSGKSKRLKFDGLLLSKKYMPSAKTLYTEDLSNITFNYFCENSPNYLCHF